MSRHFIKASASLLAAVCILNTSATGQSEIGWRGDEASSSWLSIKGAQRTRFEILSGPNVFGPVEFVDNMNGDVFADDGFLDIYGNDPIGLVSLQTSIRAKATAGRVSFVVEAMDSRSYTPVNGSENCTPPELFDSCYRFLLVSTNALEPIQSYVSYSFGDETNAPSELIAGRFTMTLGAGRLVGRSEFRNTVQSYFGVLAGFNLNGDDRLTLFYTLPHPKDFEIENSLSYDIPDIRRHFWGLHYAASNLFNGVNGELYLYGRYGTFGSDYDGAFADRFTASSALDGLQFTPGLRVYKPAAAGIVDFDIEGAVQISGKPFRYRGNDEFRNEPDLGYFVHAELGRSFQRGAMLRVSAIFDVASGRKNNYEETTEPGPFTSDVSVIGAAPNYAAFDPLYGAFDNNFGPEGLYGILAYTDIISGAFRLETALNNRFSARATYRASKRFSENRNGSFGVGPDDEYYFGSIALLSSGVSHQIDAKLDYWLVPEKVQLELGGAYFTQQTKLKDPVFGLPLASVDEETLERNNTLYGYSSIKFSF